MPKKALSVLMLTLILPCCPLYAGSGDLPVAIDMPYRILRGATNVALAWTEILLRPIGEYQSEGIFEAMGNGAANTAIRMTAGLQDITTFWVRDIQMLDLYPDWQGWPYLFHWS